jgi:hypothetical protein
MTQIDEEVKVDAADDVEEETPEADLKDTTDWKAEAVKARGIASRLRTKLTKAEEKKVEAPAAKETKTNVLDKLDRAILRVEKITAEKEIELVQDIMKETGKDIEAVLASKYFQAELKEMREAQATKEATPSGTKRSGQSPRDDVDYWLAKGPGPEGLPKDNPELARKVVAARMATIKSRNTFSDDPIQ